MCIVCLLSSDWWLGKWAGVYTAESRAVGLHYNSQMYMPQWGSSDCKHHHAHATRAQPNKNEKKGPWNCVKVNNMTKRWYNMTKRWYQVTKRWYNMTKRSILFNSTAAAMALLSQSDPNSAYDCYGTRYQNEGNLGLPVLHVRNNRNKNT